MNKRAQILADLAKASTLDEQRHLVAELETLDRQAVTAAREDRDLDWTNDVVRQTLSPVPVHEFHTASTEWFGEVDTDGGDYHPQIIAAAAVWHRSVSPEVKADDDEYATQAFAKMRREASRFGTSANDAFASAWEYLSFLRRREGASGLPQIDQTVAPDGETNAPTPLPADVFDTFGPEIHPINQGVSGTEDSNRAPLLQENGPSQGRQETLHSTAPSLTNQGQQPVLGSYQPSLAIGHVMNLDEFARREAAREAQGPTKAARKTAADGDSSQADDVHYPGNFGSSDQNGSAAIDRLVEATGLPAEQVRQKFPNPQEAVRVIDALGDSKKAASKQAVDERGKVRSPEDYNTDDSSRCDNCRMGNHTGSNGTAGCTGGNCSCPCRGRRESSLQTEAIYHESYGDVSRAQLAAYRKHNISPSDHDDLVDHFGEGNHDAITKWVKSQAAEHGSVSTWRLRNGGGGPGVPQQVPPLFGRESTKEAASTLDQIQQTTAPDGITQRPTPLPEEVAFPLISNDEMSSEQLVDPDPRAAVEKAAAMDGHGNTCRNCGQSLSQATASKTPSGESLYTCACGTKNYLQRAASKSFTPDDALAHPEFFKGYGFARNWRTGSRLIRLGTAEFEAGLYAGITDNTEHQAAWVAAHRKQASTEPEFAQRIDVHERFTERVALAQGLRSQGSYVKVATTETDLATTSPGTSPSPTGDTPINGPGRPGPLAGYEDPAAAGGPSPYNGAEPIGRPVVPGAIAPAAIVPPEVTHNGPPNPFANQQTVAFRRRVQAGLVSLRQEG